jgi:uncharacterized repeat protein (TIGR03803 family)
MSSWIQLLRVTFLTLISLIATTIIGQTVTTLHDFGSNRDGENPQAGVIFDDVGNLYGTAALGAVDGNGVVFRLTPPVGGGAPWTERVLHKFTSTPDGAVPAGDLIFFSRGRLIGTTLEGGDHNMGAVFELRLPDTPSSGPRTHVVYSFGSFPGDGVAPNSSLLALPPAFYGVTRDGGADGRGTVFQLTPPDDNGNGWVETILHSFTSSGDGSFPSSELTVDEAGNLYGTTLVGGANNLGAVYQLSPPASEGDTWTETVIFSFSGSDGTLPFGRLEMDQNGVIYGTTDGGGSLLEGTVYQLSPPSQRGGAWAQSVLFNFSGGSDGGNPTAGVIIDKKGTLFGTASTGGNGIPFPGGVIFRLDPPQTDGGAWTETVLHAFGGPDGFRSVGRLLRRPDGIYGTTSLGGLNGTGTVFVLTP